MTSPGRTLNAAFEHRLGLLHAGLTSRAGRALTFAMSKLPLWVRAVRRLDGLAFQAYRTHEIVRDEALFAWLPPELRATVTVDAYSELPAYLPGGVTYEAGLFPWERALIGQPAVPRSGRVLLGAAGGGRELKALSELGYEVVAFEPNGTLLAGALATAASYPKAQVVRASFADLASAVQGAGPLAASFSRPFDWVLLGWGSFTHVTTPAEQLALLSTLRALAPNAPLGLSFFLRPPEARFSRSLRVRLAVRRAFRLLGGRAAPPAGLAYAHGGAFVYKFTEQELRALANLAGYDVACFEASPYPHALLVPTDERACVAD